MIRLSRTAALLLLGTATLAGCRATGPVAAGSAASPAGAARPAAVPSAADSSGTDSSAADSSGIAANGPASTGPASTGPTSTGAGSGPVRTSATSGKKPSSRATHTSSGPRIVRFRIAQRPKCEEGTAVFRAKAVPLIIEWKITGATGGALSVDDPTHTPGTYGPVALQGTEEFRFSCAGAVGTVEKHTYALYTVGGGEVRSKTLTATAKVLDKGLGTNN